MRFRKQMISIRSMTLPLPLPRTHTHRFRLNTPVDTVISKPLTLNFDRHAHESSRQFGCKMQPFFIFYFFRSWQLQNGSFTRLSTQTWELMGPVGTALSHRYILFFSIRFRFASCSDPAPESDLGKTDKCLLSQLFETRLGSLLRPFFAVKALFVFECQLSPLSATCFLF